MLRNFFTIALRNLFKQRSFTFINITGLASGVACCFIILLFIQSELAVDRHHQQLEQLFRLNTIFIGTSNSNTESAASAPPVGAGLMQEIPEIESFTRIFAPLSANEYLITYQGKQFYESEWRIADSTFFQLFNFPFIEGNPEQALKEPNSIAISHTLAKKLFGNQEAKGKIITLTDDFGKHEMMVTGVYDNAQYRSHLKANYITSISTEGWGTLVEGMESWATQNFIYTYFKLNQKAEIKLVNEKIAEVVALRAADDFEKVGFKKEHRLEPVEDIYLHSTANNNWTGKGSYTFIKILATITLLILVLASVNYVNLTTAKSVQRAREVGLRKTLGAHRSQLMRQFLIEAFLLSFISVAIGVVLSYALLPYFNELFNLSLTIDILNNPFQLIIIIIIALLVGLLSGFYPAVVLSGIMPIKALKMNNQLSGGGNNLRRGLVIVQFVIAISLLICVTVIFKQLQYSLNYDDNLNTNAKIILPLRTDQTRKNFNQHQFELLKNPSIEKIANANYVPGKFIFTDFMIYNSGKSQEKGKVIKHNRIDTSYVNIFDLKIIAGRNINSNDNLENIMINKETAKVFEWEPQESIGKILLSNVGDTVYKFNVIGVIDNYNHLSVHQEIDPLMFSHGGNEYQNAIVQFEADQLAPTVELLQDEWAKMDMDTPFDYYFLDDSIADQYVQDKKSMAIISIFAIIAIIISGLGLYGLSTFTVQKRSKEISVRKVLGAKASGLVLLLTRQYLNLIALAFLITVPITYFLMNKWLQNFAYHIKINFDIYMIIGLIVAIFTLLIISFHTYKSALQNPISALRND